MRIAFITQWHYNMQRNHHLVIQAVKNGHTAHVYTPPGGGLLRPSPPKVPYTYATSVMPQRVRIVENLLIRITGRDSIFARRRTARMVSRWQSLWNSESKEQYDAVVFCGPVPCMVERKRWNIPLVYDCLDQWDGFPNAHPRTLEFEDSLAQVADIIWGVTPELVNRLSNRHGAEKCHLVPNGCDYDHFASSKKVRRPAQWKPNTPVIGYAGVVDAWFDWDAVLAIASALPGGIVWIIGSCNTTVPQSLPSNVVLEGFVPYEELPPYYAGFDISIIPFKGDVLLKGVSPIKLYEYLAAGKPVVSSAMADALQSTSPGIVEVAMTPENFAQSCLRLANTTSDEMIMRKRRELAQKHTWASRWMICEKLIKQLIS